MFRPRSISNFKSAIFDLQFAATLIKPLLGLPGKDEAERANGFYFVGALSIERRLLVYEFLALIRIEQIPPQFLDTVRTERWRVPLLACHPKRTLPQSKANRFSDRTANGTKQPIKGYQAAAKCRNNC